MRRVFLVWKDTFQIKKKKKKVTQEPLPQGRERQFRASAFELCFPSISVLNGSCKHFLKVLSPLTSLTDYILAEKMPG